MVIRINRKEYAFLYFWLLFFMPLAVVRVVPKAEILGMILRLPVFFSCCHSLLKSKGIGFRYRGFWWLFALFYLWNSFCLLIHTPNKVLSYASDLYPCLEAMIVTACMINAKSVYNGLKPLYYTSVFYIFTNFLSILFFPKGIYVSGVGSIRDRAQWLFGSKNNMPVYMILFSLIVLLCVFLNRRIRLFGYITIALAAITTMSAGELRRGFLDGSSTGIIVFMLMFLGIISLERGRKKEGAWLFRLFTNRYSFLLVFAIHAVFLAGFSSSSINTLISSLFNKDITFSGRVYIWQNAISYIGRSPVTGHGYTSVAFSSAGATSTYNFFLGIMKSFGIVSLLILFIIMLVYWRKMSGVLSSKIASFGLLLVLINGLMSQINLKFVVFFFVTILCLEHAAETEAPSEAAAARSGRKIKIQFRKPAGRMTNWGGV